MTDKYEEMALRRLRNQGPQIHCICQFCVSKLAEDFRWFDKQRDQETCEWKTYQLPIGQVMSDTGQSPKVIFPRWKTSCGRIAQIEPENYCFNCGRRIEEVKDK